MFVNVEKSVKVATQLFTYTEETMKKIFGSSHSLFDQLKNTSNVQAVKPKNASSKKDAKTGSAKSKKGSVKSKEGKKKIDEIEEATEIVSNHVLYCMIQYILIWLFKIQTYCVNI